MIKFTVEQLQEKLDKLKEKGIDEIRARVSHGDYDCAGIEFDAYVKGEYVTTVYSIDF